MSAEHKIRWLRRARNLRESVKDMRSEVAQSENKSGVWTLAKGEAFAALNAIDAGIGELEQAVWEGEFGRVG